MNTLVLKNTVNRIRLSNKLNRQLIQPRLLTTQCSDALNKFRGAVEDYRILHYRQEMPSRCKKEILKAACTKGDGDDVITIDGIEAILVNIGAEKKVSRQDVEAILSEVGTPSVDSRNCTVSMNQMLGLL